tara:strand:+ start:570 stop:674 length:105 start_codon:yes stop_codon:yes gene_type:complete
MHRAQTAMQQSLFSQQRITINAGKPLQYQQGEAP